VSGAIRRTNPDASVRQGNETNSTAIDVPGVKPLVRAVAPRFLS
jgi:hypothetical protein